MIQRRRHLGGRQGTAVGLIAATAEGSEMTIGNEKGVLQS